MISPIFCAMGYPARRTDISRVGSEAESGSIGQAWARWQTEQYRPSAAANSPREQALSGWERSSVVAMSMAGACGRQRRHYRHWTISEGRQTVTCWDAVSRWRTSRKLRLSRMAKAARGVSGGPRLSGERTTVPTTNAISDNVQLCNTSLTTQEPDEKTEPRSGATLSAKPTTRQINARATQLHLATNRSASSRDSMQPQQDKRVS